MLFSTILTIKKFRSFRTNHLDKLFKKVFIPTSLDLVILVDQLLPLFQTNMAFCVANHFP